MPTTPPVAMKPPPPVPNAPPVLPGPSPGGLLAEHAAMTHESNAPTDTAEEVLKWFTFVFRSPTVRQCKEDFCAGARQANQPVSEPSVHFG